MVDALTITAKEYAVLARVPAIWWDEDETVAEIANGALLTRAIVRQHLTRLEKLHLVERRRLQTISPTHQVRRIGRSDGD